jgi:hypothetical protein
MVMNLADRIQSFEMLGDRLRRYDDQSADVGLVPLIEASRASSARNPWFTPEHVRTALKSLGQALKREDLDRWLSGYEKRMDRACTPKTIGVVMAGNIPAVGFHDFMCVLISGHKLQAKLSSSDDRLLPAMAHILADSMPEWEDYITFTTGRLEKFDAIIATGNTNTSRYFEYYFGRYPHIIRKNRNSIAVLNGLESRQDLQNLADDILLFFGMGCRSVSKVYVPPGYDFLPLITTLGKYSHFINHNKFCNNYEYFKSIFLVNRVPFLDTGFLLLKEDTGTASRIAVLHYEYYDHPEELAGRIIREKESIQCVISTMPLPVKTLRPGEAQNPALWDYADQVDTMEFLISSV